MQLTSTNKNSKQDPSNNNYKYQKTGNFLNRLNPCFPSFSWVSPFLLLNCAQETEFTVGPGESGSLGPWRKHHFSRLPEIHTTIWIGFIAFIGLWSKWSNVSCNLCTLPETNIFAPEKRMVGSDDPFILGPGLFSGDMLVVGRVYQELVDDQIAQPDFPDSHLIHHCHLALCRI